MDYTSPYGSRLDTYRSDFSSKSSKDTPGVPVLDTVHYLSPVSTPCPTECEGDFDYQQLVFGAADLQPLEAKAGSAASVSSSEVSCILEDGLQRTVAIVKPEAMCYKDVVLRAVDKAGFRIVHHRTVHLSPEQVSEIYAKFYGSPAFPNLVVSVSVSPVLALALAGVNAVEKWKTLIGPYGTLREEWFFPYSVRTRFGYRQDIPGVLHASENVYEAKKENRFFYPRDILEPLPIDEFKVKDYITLYLRPTLLNALTELVRVKPIDPVLFLAEWLLLNNPFQPKLPEKIALTPT